MSYERKRAESEKQTCIIRLKNVAYEKSGDLEKKHFALWLTILIHCQILFLGFIKKRLTFIKADS